MYKKRKYYQNAGKKDLQNTSNLEGGSYLDSSFVLPEVVVTAKNPYPYKNQLSKQELKYFNTDNSIGRYVRSIAKDGKRGNTANDLKTLAVKFGTELANQAKEATGVPAAIRTVKAPLQAVKAINNTIGDAVAFPIALPYSLYNYAKKGSFDIGKNPLTNEYYGQGLDKSLDALSLLPVGKLASKLSNFKKLPVNEIYTIPKINYTPIPLKSPLNIEEIVDIIKKYKKFEPTEFQKAYRKAAVKYRNLSFSEENIQRAKALDAKYGTHYYDVMKEQYERGNSLDNIWTKEENYLPSYAETHKKGFDLNGNGELIAGEDYRGIVTYPKKQTDDFFDINYYAKAKSRNYAVAETDNLKNVYSTVSHEDKHLKDIAANIKKRKVKYNINKDEYLNKIFEHPDVIDEYYKAYKEDMFHKLEDLPEHIQEQLSKKIGKTEPTLYEYFTTPTEVESHVMTNMRDELVNKGYLKTHWDMLDEETLNKFFDDPTLYNYRKIEYPYKHLIKDKKAFIDRFNEATYSLFGSLGTGYLINKNQQNNNKKELRKTGGIQSYPKQNIEKYINNTGYLNNKKTNKNPVNLIPSNYITSTNMKFPIWLNKGLPSQQLLYPNTGDRFVNTPYRYKGKPIVIETPA